MAGRHRDWGRKAVMWTAPYGVVFTLDIMGDWAFRRMWYPSGRGAGCASEPLDGPSRVWGPYGEVLRARVYADD